MGIPSVRRHPHHSPSSSHGHASPRLIMMTVHTSGHCPRTVCGGQTQFSCALHLFARPSTLLFVHACTPRTPTHLLVHTSTSLTIPLVHALGMLPTHAPAHMLCPPNSLVDQPSYASAYSPVCSQIQMLTDLRLHLPNLLAHWLADRQAHLLGQSSVRLPMSLFANSCMQLDASLLTRSFTCLFTCMFARLLICRLGHFPIHLPATSLPTLWL